MNNSKKLLIILVPICLVCYNNCAESFRSSASDITLNLDSNNSENDHSDSQSAIDSPQNTVENPETTTTDPIIVPSIEIDKGPALMAVGHMQSTMFSCDGGFSWVGYQSANNNRRCWDANTGNFDCDHDSTSALGVTWGDDGFMATFGWGAPGQVVVTKDGSNWTSVFQGAIFAGVSYGNSRYFLNSEYNTQTSVNGGLNWQKGGNILSIPYNQRKTFFIKGGGGRFVSLSSSSNVVDIMISKDNGRTFNHPNVLPAGCGDGQYAMSDQLIMIYSQRLCTSVDFGDTWIATDLPTGNFENLIFNGNEFRMYSAGYFLRSNNTIPVVWTRQNLTLDGVASPSLELSLVTYQPDLKKYSATNQNWGRWYEQTQFYYSDDGIHWLRVNKESGLAPLAPHPLKAIVSGYLDICKINRQ